jgi:hypothetical protein
MRRGSKGRTFKASYHQRSNGRLLLIVLTIFEARNQPKTSVDRSAIKVSVKMGWMRRRSTGRTFTASYHQRSNRRLNVRQPCIRSIESHRPLQKATRVVGLVDGCAAQNTTSRRDVHGPAPVVPECVTCRSVCT